MPVCIDGKKYHKIVVNPKSRLFSQKLSPSNACMFWTFSLSATAISLFMKVYICYKIGIHILTLQNYVIILSQKTFLRLQG